MKLKTLIAAFLICNIGIASAQTLKPLSDYVNEGKPDPARLSYVMSRCSAIFLNFATITSDSNPTLSKSYLDWSITAMEKFIGLSEVAIKQTNPAYVPPANQVDKANGTVREFQKYI